MNVLVLDPAIEEPYCHCFNDLVKNFPEHRFSYWQVGMFPRQSPTTFSGYDAILILGSASNVTEPLDWHEPLAQKTVGALNAGTPVLGICFGHQLMCHTFGASVSYMFPDERALKGVRTININKNFGGFSQSTTLSLAVTHAQHVTNLPADLETLASSAEVACEIVRHKTLPFWGIQTHPEASEYFMENDIGGMSPKEKLIAKDHGLLFLRRFLDHFA